MNALLRIQVKLLAKEANNDLKALARAIKQVNDAQSGGGRSGGSATSQMNKQMMLSGIELKKIQQGLDELSHASTFTTLGKQAEAYKKKLDSLNKSVHEMGNTNQSWQSTGDSVNVTKGRAAAAKEAAATLKDAQALSAVKQRAAQEAEQLAQRQAEAVIKAQKNEYDEGVKSVNAQMQDRKKAYDEQVRDAKRASDLAVAAQREADNAEKASIKERDVWMKGIWQNQVLDAKTAQEKQTAAVKEAAEKQKAIIKETAEAEKAAKAAAASQPASFLGKLNTSINGDIQTTRKGLIGMGKDLQWVGRQINFNFTLPLVYAGKQALDFVLANESAFTALRKVYAGAEDDLDGIRKGLRLLSDYYGTNQAEVIKLGEAWAAAGMQGRDLLKSVQNSLDLSILGDYANIGDTFDALIVIQKAYGLSVDQTALAIAKMNTVEDAAATDMVGLVTAIATVGSSANDAGISLDQLIAMMAVLTPATGSASKAANSFKTIVANLMAPTDKITGTLKDMGINFYDTTFQMKDGAERLQYIAEKFIGLTDAQQAYVSRTLGSLWGINKFSALMKDLSSNTSEYAKALASVGDNNEAANLAQAQREIQTLLNSDPQKFQRLMTMLQNMLADVMLPLLPVLIGILTVVKNIATWFGNLAPAIQKTAVGFLVFIAAIGIITQMVGSVELLFGTFAKFALFVVGMIPGISLGAQTAAAATAASTLEIVGAIGAGTAALTAEIAASATAAVAITAEAAMAETAIVGASAATMAAEAAAAEAAIAGEVAVSVGATVGMVLAIAAAIALIVLIIWKNFDTIKKWIKSAIQFIIDGFYSLPGAVARAFTAVVNVIASAIKVVIHWLSYLNPFARHSPSLVDNVTNGVDVILNQYRRLQNVGSIFSKAASDLRSFGNATAGALAAAKQSDRNDTTIKVASVAPSAVGPLNNLYNDLDALSPHLADAKAAMDAQQQLVDRLKKTYDAAATAVDRFDNSLEPLRQKVDSLKDGITAAKDAISSYASTNITGMGAADDAIFDNEQAQKRLRLEILKLGQAGISYDKIQEKLAALNGEIENIRGKMTDLRQAGAGSDILSVYQDQINGLEAQKAGLSASAASTKELEDQLAALQTTGERLDLEKSLNFDGLLRQIDKLANGVKEMSFDEIVAGIKMQQAAVTDLTKDYDANKAVLDQQEAVLATMKAGSDALKDSYDAENASLDILKASYQTIVDQMTAIEDAIKAVVDAYSTLQQAKDASSGSSGGGAGAGGGFGDLTGSYDEPKKTYTDPKRQAQTIEDYLKGLQDSLANMLGDFNPLKLISKGWGAVIRFFGRIGSFLWDWIKDVGSWFVNLPETILHGLGTAGSVLLGWGAELVTGLWRGIVAATPVVMGWFQRLPANVLSWIGSAVNWLWDTGLKVTKGLALGLIDGAFAIMDFFVALPGNIIDWIGDALTWIYYKGWDTVQGMLDGLFANFENVMNWALNLGQTIFGWVGDVAKTLWNKGVDFIAGMLLGINNKVEEVKAWATRVPNDIYQWVGDVTSKLWQKGSDLIAGLQGGIMTAVVSVYNFFSTLANVAFGWIGNVASTLYQKGLDLLSGLGNGITSGVVAVYNFFTSLPGVVFGKIGDVLGTLWHTGWDFIQGLMAGLISGIQGLWTWVSGIASGVVKNIPNPLDVLADTGKKIIQGLWDGMKSVWKNVTGWLSSITDMIPDWKGPAKKDASLLTENGRLVMQGFQEGLMSGWSDTQKLLGSMTNQLPTAFDTTLVNKSITRFENMTAANTVSPSGQNIDNSRTINVTIHELSLPNITDPADAETLLSNLESLV